MALTVFERKQLKATRSNVRMQTKRGTESMFGILIRATGSIGR